MVKRLQSRLHNGKYTLTIRGLECENNRRELIKVQFDFAAEGVLLQQAAQMDGPDVINAIVVPSGVINEVRARLKEIGWEIV